MMKTEIQHIHLNNELITKKEIIKIVKSLCDARIIREKGGFLFKSSFQDGHFHIGLLPYILEGERTYHYDISLSEECTYKLTGFINSNMTMTILPDVADSGQVTFSEQDKDNYIEQYIKLSEFLTEHGFNSEFPFDPVTMQALQDIGLAGKNIKELN